MSAARISEQDAAVLVATDSSSNTGSDSLLSVGCHVASGTVVKRSICGDGDCRDTIMLMSLRKIFMRFEALTPMTLKFAITGITSQKTVIMFFFICM